VRAVCCVVSQSAENPEPTISSVHVVCARADVAYMSLLVWAPPAKGILVPNSHHFHGINNRFAYGDRASMVDVYMNYSDILGSKRLLDWSHIYNTEGQLCSKMVLGNVAVGLTDNCIIRVRSNGQCGLKDSQPSQAVQIGACLSDRLHTTAASQRASCAPFESAVAPKKEL